MAEECCAPDFESESDDDVAAERFWDMPAARLAAAAGAFLLGGFLAHAFEAELFGTALYVGALVIGGSTFVPETIAGLRRGRLGVGTLMSVAAAGAVALGEFGEAASLAFLFSISEALEIYALARTRRGLRALLDLVPERVSVRRDSVDMELAPDDLVVGDVMVVRPGERVATDGIVRSGRSALDVSAVTGESVPVEATPGSSVYAASINGGGVLEIDVTAPAADNSLARVVRIVEEAQGRKGQSQRLADRIARPLVPAIMVVSTLVATVGSLVGDPRLWINRALVVLVAAAPCAFAIAVPVTVVAAIGAASRAGALVKGGAALEALARIRVVALDKTGTLTRNRPTVINVIACPRTHRDNVLRVGAALEARSEHPLAGAIVAAAPNSRHAEDVQAVAGHGLTGVVDGTPARLGKPGFIDPGALADDVARLQSHGATVVLVELGDRLLGAIAVRDELRPEVPEVVRLLRQLGMKPIVMLTGDNKATAEALAQEAGLDEVAAELLPAEKAAAVTQLHGRGPVGMIGDGINDAPALATADVGIAMGALGSDVAIEAADAALMGEDLTQLPTLFSHSQRAGRIMVQNLILSGAIIATLIPLAALGVLGLATVVATHEIAEVIVIANGVRAGRRPGGLGPARRRTARRGVGAPRDS